MKTKLSDGTPIHCLLRPEALVLDHHVEGYFTLCGPLPDDAVILDVGANIGVFAVRARQRFPAGRVLAFEPVPPIYSILQQNAELHGQGQIQTLPAAAGSAPGSLDIEYFPNSPALSTAHSAFWDEEEGRLAEAVRGNVRSAPPELWYARWVPSFLAPWIARRMRRGSQSYTCSVLPLSQVLDEQSLDRVDLLKIDCEGAEWEALLGLGRDHAQRVQRVIIEVHDVQGRLEQVRELLSSWGLSQQRVEHEEGFENTPLVNLFAAREGS